MRAGEQGLSYLGTFLPGFAWSMIWQSSLLIGLLFVCDFVLSRKLRPAVRYALWLLVLIKLILPPSLAFPTGLAWWVRPSELRAGPARTTSVLVRYGGSGQALDPAKTSSAPITRQRSVVTPQAWWVFLLLAGALALFTWMGLRWRLVAVAAGCATPASADLQRLLWGASDLLRFRSSVRLRMTDKTSTPVVLGFLRPVILLPASLPSRLSESQLRAVLLHELIHIRRGDVWVNCLQTLLQMAYWWHPLLWLANARIRRIREEAVDDAVMLAMEGEDETYPQALLEVAKLALGKPLSSLALVGILETRHALRRRIERLLNRPGCPGKGLTLASIASLVAFGALALPMGQATSRMAGVSETPSGASDEWPDPRFAGYSEVSLRARFLIVEPTGLELFLPSLAAAQGPLVLASNELSEVERKLAQADAQSFPRNQSLSFAQFSGGRFHYHVGGVPGNAVNYLTQTRSNGSTVVVGAECSSYVGTRPDWVPLDFTMVPWTYRDSTLCHVRLGVADDPGSGQQTEVTIPSGSAMLWRVPGELRTGKSEFVLLKEGKSAEDSQEATRASEPKLADENEQITRLLLDARSFYGAGKMDEAAALLQKALAKDHNSQAARYYLRLIEEARASQPPPVRPMPVEQNQVQAAKTPQSILATITRIRLNHVSFNDQPLSEVLENLNHEVSPLFAFRTQAGASADTNQNVGNVRIRILPALTDVRLADVLDAIVKVAARPIQYSIETNGVVFSYGRPKPMYTRIMKVDPNAVLQGLAPIGDVTNVGVSLRSVLHSKGVELQPPETLFFNDREGSLLVRAAGLEKLNQIESAVSELVNPPAQLNIKTRFLRLPDAMLQDLRSSLGISNTVGNSSSKILTPAQTAVLLQAMDTKGRGYLLNEASVTTLSGRQVEVECVDLQSILSNNVPIQIPLGPAIDLTPRLGTEGWKIGLRIVASLREFLGYDDPVPPTFEDPGSASRPTFPIPHIRLKQMKADTTVPDGYTVVLVNPVDEKSELAEKPGTSELHYVVLLTPSVLDSTGKRLHSDVEIEALCR